MVSFLIRGAMTIVAVPGLLAIVYSTQQPSWLRLSMAFVFALIIGVAVSARTLRRGILLWLGASVLLTAWYVTDRPSDNREWAVEYAVPAMVHQTGRTVLIQHIRNFTYRSETDLTPGYYDAVFNLDDLASLDLITSYWAGPAIAHVFVSFGFRDGRDVVFSIETRRQKNGVYSTLAGFFHHYELFYVVADERDAIGLRTDIRRERVYLYRVHVSPEAREQLFLSYIDKVASLAHRPEWYNTLTDNCTTGILGRAHAGALEIAYNWRVLLSGYAAEYAYRLGLLSDPGSFPELQRRSRIVRPDGATIDDGFSAEIRRGVPD